MMIITTMFDDSLCHLPLSTCPPPLDLPLFTSRTLIGRHAKWGSDFALAILFWKADKTETNWGRDRNPESIINELNKCLGGMGNSEKARK